MLPGEPGCCRDVVVACQLLDIHLVGMRGGGGEAVFPASLQQCLHPEVQWAPNGGRNKREVPSRVSFASTACFFCVLFERQSYRQRFTPPNGGNGWSWADLKPAARSIFWVSNLGAGAQGLGTIFHCFLRSISRELNQKWSSQDLNPYPYGMLEWPQSTNC